MDVDLLFKPMFSLEHSLSCLYFFALLISTLEKAVSLDHYLPLFFHLNLSKQVSFYKTSLLYSSPNFSGSKINHPIIYITVNTNEVLICYECINSLARQE